MSLRWIEQFVFLFALDTTNIRFYWETISDLKNLHRTCGRAQTLRR